MECVCEREIEIEREVLGGRRGAAMTFFSSGQMRVLYMNSRGGTSGYDAESNRSIYFEGIRYVNLTRSL